MINKLIVLRLFKELHVYSILLNKGSEQYRGNETERIGLRFSGLRANLKKAKVL